MFGVSGTKRKLKASTNREKWTLSTIFICVFGCTMIAGLLFVVTGRVHSNVRLLNNLSSYQEIEPVLLQHIPLGSSYDEVQAFVENSLNPSQNCFREPRHDLTCKRVFGTVFLCKYVIWTIRFRFEDERLTDISVVQTVGC